jgi:glycosyltransferase involved in cell wall biosynthesis
VNWHLVTGEFPPDCGGVGDYSADLARALAAAGDTVHVWTTGPASAAATGPGASGPGIVVHGLPDRFGRHSRSALEEAWRATPGVVLLQYVPNAFGARGANLPFCIWLRGVHRAGADVRVMFHEPYFYFTLVRPWRNALAIVQRAMAATLLRAANTIYMSTETWSRYLGRNAAHRRFQALPIPSSIPSAPDPALVNGYRRQIARYESIVIGHFGTYGDHVRDALLAVLPGIHALLPDARFAFVGAGGGEFLDRLHTRLPGVAARAWASGRVGADDVAALLRACDLLIQPYPDGITTRRTSAMAGLKNGVATVTTSGELTERVWTDSAAVALVPAEDPQAFADTVARLIKDPEARATLAAAGARAYERHFSMPHTIAMLREAPAEVS